MRTLLSLAVGLAFAAAAAVYGLGIETRRLETRVLRGEQRAERLRAEIELLEADLVHLARPDRIAPAALALGLRPMQHAQIAGDPVAALAILSSPPLAGPPNTASCRHPAGAEAHDRARRC